MPLITLHASGAETDTGNGSTFTTGYINNAFFELDVTAAATDAADTLDVFVQTQIDGSWTDVVHFTQATGTGGAVRHIAKIVASEPQAMFEVGIALAEGSIRNVLGSYWRCRWDIVDAVGDDASFTFSLKAQLEDIL